MVAVAAEVKSNKGPGQRDWMAQRVDQATG